MVKKSFVLVIFLAMLLSPAIVLAAEEAAGAEAEAADSSTGDLAKKTQNPVSDLISLPIQTNFNFKVRAKDKTQSITLVQPVIPMSLTDEWNVIVRPILPLVNQPETPRQGRTFGLGDLNLQTFFTPAKPGKVIWGIGPSLVFPTATDDVLGTEQWSAGPAFVILTMNGPWVYGGRREPGLVLRRGKRPRRRQPDDDSAVSQLQPARGLVPDQLSGHDGRLGGTEQRGLDDSPWRRCGQDIPHW